MLLITFHGGKTGIRNAYAYDTSTGERNTQTALSPEFDHRAELQEPCLRCRCQHPLCGERRD